MIYLCCIIKCCMMGNSHWAVVFLLVLSVFDAVSADGHGEEPKGPPVPDLYGEDGGMEGGVGAGLRGQPGERPELRAGPRPPIPGGEPAPPAEILTFPQPKIWWARRILPDVYTAGIMAERQVKYAGEAGFKSLISMYNITLNRTVGDEILPNWQTEKYIAEELAGMYYDVIVTTPDDTMNWVKDSVTKRMAEVLKQAPKPVLVHCMSAVTSSLHIVGAMAMHTRADPSFFPPVRTREWMRIIADLGLDLDDLLPEGPFYQLMANITGEPEVTSHIRPVISVPNIVYKLWEVIPVWDNWYVTGQLTRSMLEKLKAVPTMKIINLRKGQKQGRMPEEVTLLNVADDTGENRQTDAKLLENRLDPSLPPAYVDWDSDVNYEKLNMLEFGDMWGYNETGFAWHVNNTLGGNLGYKYINTPMSDEDLGIHKWNKHHDAWMKGSRHEHNIIVSRDASSALVIALLCAGKQQKKPASWALERSRFLGFDFEMDRPEVVQLFWEVLGQPGYPEVNAAPAHNAISVMTTIALATTMRKLSSL